MVNSEAVWLISQMRR